MSLAIEWAAFQDNILAAPDHYHGISIKQVQLMVILLRKTLVDSNNRQDVMDLLFNPAAGVVRWPVSSTKNLSSPMAKLFLDVVLQPGKKECSPKGEEFIRYLERIVMDRNKLKGQLYNKRIRMTQEGAFPLCAFCGLAITDRGAAMHEAIITRGDVQKWDPELIDLIMTEENCVLVHPGMCHNNAQGKAGQTLVLKHLLEHVHAEQIALWLNILPFRSSLGVQALNLLKETANG